MQSNGDSTSQIGFIFFGKILTVKMEGFSKYPKGIVKRSDVEKFLLKKSKFPKIYMSQYFKLLEKFQIALPLGEDQLLIPSR